MNTAIWYRRRAERLAGLLDDPSGGHHHRARSHRDELADLVTLARRLSGLAGAQAAPDPQFRLELRAQLVARAQDGIDTTPAPPARRPAILATVPPPRQLAIYTGVAPRPHRVVRRPRCQGRPAREVIAIGLASAALAVYGVSLANEGSAPADVATPGSATEQAQLAQVASATAKGRLYLTFAGQHVDQAMGPGLAPLALGWALTAADNDVRAGLQLLATEAMRDRDPAVLAALDWYVSAQIPRLQALAGHGGPANARIAGSIGLLQAIAERSAALKAAVACGAGTRSTDTLGPVPAPCRHRGHPHS